MLLHVLEGVGIAVTVLLALGGGWALWRGGGGTALETLQLANRVLEVRVKDLEAVVVRLTAENAALAARTNFVLALQPIMTWADTHEAQAAKRSESMLTVLDLIAAKLGADE